jgi:glycosyltransferase involved in cell wall biosynthesis
MPAADTIVIVLHDFPLGGTERIAIRLANRWAGLGRRVTIFAGCLAGPLRALVDPQVEIVEAAPPIPRGFRSRARLGLALRRFLEARRFDILYVPGNFHWPLLPALQTLAVDRRPRIVAQISTPLERRGRSGIAQFIYERITRHRLRPVDALIALAPETIPVAARIVPGTETVYLPLPALDEAPSGRDVAPAAGKTILIAARLVKEKGIETALRAFARLGDPAARLVVVGAGPRYIRLRELTRRLYLTRRVRFDGFVPDIRPRLEEARLLLLPSFYEECPAVMLEALAAGRPVVATRCSPAVVGLLQNKPGCRLVPVGDEAAMADALRAALAEPAPVPAVLAAAAAPFQIGPVAEAYLSVFDRWHAGAVSPPADANAGRDREPATAATAKAA